jgi:hypothetical protein
MKNEKRVKDGYADDAERDGRTRISMDKKEKREN